MSAPLDVSESERLVSSLRELGVSSIGRSFWLAQHRALDRLNAAAHAAAHARADDFVLAALLTFDKLPTLLAELLAAEAWREHVFPAVFEHVASGGGGRNGALRAYFGLHHEAVLLNMLELFLFHDYAAEALGDGLVDLIDYLVRRATHLAALAHERQRSERAGASAGPPAVDATRVTPADVWDDGSVAYAADAAAAAAALKAESADSTSSTRVSLARWRGQSVLKLGVTAVTILRYISDYAARLPLSVAARLMDTHDVALLMVPLIENPPWVRRAHVGAGWQKFLELAWVDVPAGDLLRLTSIEGQPWLALHALLLEPDLRRRYALSSHRRGTLARVRRFLNEVLLDQLPVLTDLVRFLDEATIAGNAGTDADESSGRLLLEALPEITERVRAEALRAPVGWCGGAGAGTDTSAPRSVVQVVNEEGADAGERAAWTWADAAAYACKTAFRRHARRDRNNSSADAAESDDDADIIALGNAMAGSEYELGPAKCEKCGELATKRCSRCHNAWYCSRDCQVAAWSGHKTVCDLVADSGTSN